MTLFKQVRVGQLFTANGVTYKRVKQRRAPRRGYLVSNAENTVTGAKASFGPLYPVRVVK